MTKLDTFGQCHLDIQCIGGLGRPNHEHQIQFRHQLCDRLLCSNAGRDLVSVFPDMFAHGLDVVCENIGRRFISPGVADKDFHLKPRCNAMESQLYVASKKMEFRGA